MNWKRNAVAYQIYPRSFKDSNGDGIGDLNGIISKLDYLKDLGIDVIWICPIYKSPNDDNGYDISDYHDIMEDFGTIEDFENLLSEVHKRDMKLIMDLVLNHTSDEHPWFIESKSSKDNPKRDWYIWRKGKDNNPPNNWESIFGGSAWEYDENTDEYFMHLFSRRQPDLNWENKDVRQALYTTVNWWIEKGIDGFRIDAISHIKKEPGLKDMPNPQNLEFVPSFDKHMNVDGIHELLDEFNQNTFAGHDLLTVGEANGVSSDEAELWTGNENGKFDMIFQFEHLSLWDDSDDSSLHIPALKKALSKWQDALYQKGWNALFIENHDIVRVNSRWGNDKEYWKESSKSLAMMYFLQQGTPFIYQGQEIGMTNIKYEDINCYNDVATHNRYKNNVNKGMNKQKALEHEWTVSRDNARTPMQWDGSLNAGFTSGDPWIGVNPNSKDINVESQINDEDSILNFYKSLIKIRKQYRTFIDGKYELVLPDHEQIYAYTRQDENDTMLIICNLTKDEAVFESEYTINNQDLLLSNYNDHNNIDERTCKLRPYEARLYKIK
ncbi:MAG: alpha-glucosidase [Inconstantimicrobium porci]|uniref:glycoside hydrolase family 13 protein n=1 Tax=Inconstantimicrobium porci TaxID=2652291 RepID=UPI00240A5800|nr:alpha-glucosidase [Inconstantimicrobium porci]MDD6769718.1 alpha-glucosidase [Inconstantimicrobium porci]MDY5912193.1 alpha-glucosidase [Inconstantimicrobium porci]